MPSIIKSSQMVKFFGNNLKSNLKSSFEPLSNFSAGTKQINYYFYLCSPLLLCLLYLFILALDPVQNKQNTFPSQISSIQTEIDHLQLQQHENSCYIGYTDTSTSKLTKLQQGHSIIVEQKYEDFMRDISNKNWKYCIFFKSNKHNQKQNRMYSNQQKICRNRCCRHDPQQCYFKALQYKHQIQNQQIQNHARRLKNLSQDLSHSKRSLITTQQTNNKQSQSFVSQSSPEVSQTQISQESEPIQGAQVIFIILACVLGVPFLLLLFFSIISIIRICRDSSRAVVQQGNQYQFDNYITQDVNVNDYNIDDLGPYHVNLKQECPICLDENVNIRTYCGHFYHPLCIKSWLVRGKYRCPVCINTRLNPMKVYCLRCSVGVKLVILNRVSSNQFVTELSETVCESCGTDNGSIFIKQIEGDEKNSNMKENMKSQVKRDNKKNLNSEYQMISVSGTSSINH